MVAMKTISFSKTVVLAVSILVIVASLSGQSKSSATEGQTVADPLKKSVPQKPQPSPTPQSDSDVVRVETDLVTELFTAIDKDRRFVTTLRSEDIRVTEDGVDQSVLLFEHETDRPLTMVVLVDTSRSQERTLPIEKSAAQKFVDSVVRPSTDHVAVVSFTGRPRIESPLTGDPKTIAASIARLEVEFPPGGCDPTLSVDEDPRCYTSIWDSVAASSVRLLGPTGKGFRRAIILLTDGDDTSSRLQRDQAIEVAVKEDVVVYGIGIGDPDLYKLNKGSLTKLAEKTGGRAFFPKTDVDLTKAFAQIQEELRSQYVIGYSPTNRAQDGTYRKVDIQVINPELRKRKLRLLHRQGYYAKKVAAKPDQ